MAGVRELPKKLYLAMCNKLGNHGRETPRTFFCHIPKCAGTAAAQAIYRDLYFGTSHSDNFTINLQASRFSAEVCMKDMMEIREAILSYNLSQPHYRFGAAHCYCRPRLVQMHKHTWQFVTLLRNPVARWISEYVFNTYKDASWEKNKLPLQDYMGTVKGKETAISFLRYFSSIPKNYKAM